MSSSTNDEILWQKILEGNSEAFSDLYYQYNNLLLRYGYSLTRDRELIKDSIHDLFMDIWKRREQIGKILSVKGYLLKSFRRILLRKLEGQRKKWNQYNPSTLPEPSERSVEERFISTESDVANRTYLLEKINTLPPRQREILFLRFYKELDHDEIASIMEIQKQATWNLLSRALQKLRTLVEDPRNTGLLLPFIFYP